MSASLVANSSRPGNGASGAPTPSNADARPSATGGAMLHLDNGAGAEPHHLLRRCFQANAHGKALSDPHPIERALDIRDRARQVDAISIEHAGADPLNDAFDRVRTVDHRVDGGTVADRDDLEVGLAEVRD